MPGAARTPLGSERKYHDQDHDWTGEIHPPPLGDAYLPKVADLKKLFPQDYHSNPVLVMN